MQLVAENVGFASCLVLGYHVHYENDTIEGPSTEEYLQTQANSLVIGADVVLAPEAAAMQSAAKNAESALAKAADQYACGSFFVRDWSGYPQGVRQPAKDTVFRLINRNDYDVSRKLANNINERIRGRLPKLLLDDLEVHEVIPVKFGGDPTDLSNKILVGVNDLHIQLNEWWRTIQRAIER